MFDLFHRNYFEDNSTVYNCILGIFPVSKLRVGNSYTEQCQHNACLPKKTSPNPHFHAEHQYQLKHPFTKKKSKQTKKRANKSCVLKKICSTEFSIRILVLFALTYFTLSVKHEQGHERHNNYKYLRYHLLIKEKKKYHNFICC